MTATAQPARRPETGSPSSSSGPRDSIEALVASVWRSVAQRPPRDIDEDFFEAGNTSLEATLLVSALREAMGQKVPLSLFFDNPTVAGVARALRENTDGWRTRYLYRLKGGDGVPLILAPGTSGTLGWVSALASDRMDRPVLGLVSRGVYGEAEPLRNLPEIARHLLGALTEGGVAGPVHLVGSCAGGMACIEVARQAADHGIDVRSVTLLNGGYEAEQATEMERIQYRLNDIRRMAGLPRSDEELDEASISRRLRDLFDQVHGGPRVVESTVDEFTARIMVFVQNWGAAADYRIPSIPAPVTLLYTTGEEDEMGLDGWSRAACPRFEAIPVDGLRASDVGRPDVVDIIARVLRRVEAGDGA